jgi:ribosome recycling factor
VADFSIDDIERRMDGAIETLRREFAGLRAGRATTSLLEPVTVEAYGSTMPLNQIANISAPEPRLLTVQVWDAGNAAAVERAIREANLGLNPQREGQLLRIPIPELNEERRQELVKVAHKYAEQARVAIRNVRRDGMDTLKRQEKDGDISQDEHRAWADDVQALTDMHIGLVDEATETKEKEIMQV